MHYVNLFFRRHRQCHRPPCERTGERVRITDVGDGVLDVPHTATTKRPAFAGLLVYIIQFFFPCCAFMRRS